MSQPSGTVIQNLMVEVANAYKTASERAELIIQSLTNERQTLQQQIQIYKLEIADLQKQLQNCKPAIPNL